MDENKTPAPNPTPTPAPANPTPGAPAYDGLDAIKQFYDSRIKTLESDLAASVEREKQKDAIINQFVKGNAGQPTPAAPFQNNADPVAGAVNILKARYKK